MEFTIKLMKSWAATRTEPKHWKIHLYVHTFFKIYFFLFWDKADIAVDAAKYVIKQPEEETSGITQETVLSSFKTLFWFDIWSCLSMYHPFINFIFNRLFSSVSSPPLRIMEIISSVRSTNKPLIPQSSSSSGTNCYGNPNLWSCL